jgi:hypothetical protein
LVGAAVAAVLALTAPAVAEDNTRGVRILDGPGHASPPALAPPPSPLVAPPVIGAPIPALPPLVAPAPAPPLAAAPPVAPPLSSPPPPVSPAPAVSNPVAAVSPVAVPPSAPSSTYNVTSTPETGGATTVPLVDLRQLQSAIKVANPAELTLDILPGPMLTIGARVAFRISTKRAGYLILVDVDPTGKLTQIYPNPISMMSAAGARHGSNHLRPGKPLQIPNTTEAFSGFECVASPPSGTALVVAILSDRPVQLVDLPDVPTAMAGQAEALAFLTKLAGELRVPAGEAGSALHQVKWSFDAKFYAIR